jgi:hypothetical protein
MSAGRGPKWAAIATTLLLACGASAQGLQAQPAGGRGDDARPQRMGPGSMGPGPHGQHRGRGDGSGPQGMGPPVRSAQFAADDPAAPRGAQMSREERQQLRRDVHEAGRDLYPERRRGGRAQSPAAEPAPSGPPPVR